MLRIAVSLIVAGLGSTLGAGQTKTGFLTRQYKGPEGDSRYVLFVPHSYDGQKEFPLILFLHGSGESGKDVQLPGKVGLGPAIRKSEKSFPFFAIFPQSHERTWQAKSEDGKRAMSILQQVQKDYKIDGRRIYLTGLSMGGSGTWSLAAKYPDTWAAIVPICGGGNPKAAERIKDIPCWCFHGDADKAVPVQRSRDMIEALKSAGGRPLYTEFPGVPHNSWDRAYANPKLYAWLLKQTKKSTSN